jgi:hypothetical protein
MPTIAAYPDPFRAYNRVEVNWADLPGVDFARVLRVDVESGVCTPLRPYVCFFGDYLKLSCGHGIFWDTEVPLDRQVYYITEGLDAPCVPDAPILLDTYTRFLVDSWGATDTGQIYVISGGTVPGNYDVNGSVGQQTNDSVNVYRNSIIDMGDPDFDYYVDVTIPTVATGNSLTSWISGRFTDTANYYSATLEQTTTGTMGLVVNRRVAGALAAITSTVNLGAHIAGDTWRVRFQGVGSALKAKAWKLPGLEPAAWTHEVTDTNLATGNNIALMSRREVGNTNGTVIWAWDNLVSDRCPTCTPVTVDTSTAPLTMPSNGAFRLRDPVRPCNDLYVPLCFSQPSASDPHCIPGRGIFFAGMDVESYAANTLLLNPTNASRPLAANRQRRDVSSVLNLVTRTFLDRDDLLRINQPGSPLLLSGPPQYGIPDTYMSVGDMSVERGVTDHKFQVRNVLMPFLAVDRPAGPSQGVCGSRVEDLCDIYPTLDDLEAAGLSWDDLIRGRASNDSGPGLNDYRTWDDVLTEFADWDDVNSGGRTWTDVQVGD